MMAVSPYFRGLFVLGIVAEIVELDYSKLELDVEIQQLPYIHLEPIASLATYDDHSRLAGMLCSSCRKSDFAWL